MMLAHRPFHDNASSMTSQDRHLPVEGPGEALGGGKLAGGA